MVGSLLGSMMLGLLVTQAPGGMTFDGREVSARTLSSVGFYAQGPVPFPNIWERGIGSASLTAEDRVADPGALYGDKAHLEARFRLGTAEYQIELTQPGFPPAQVSGAALAGPLPRPGHPMGGGVLVDQDVYGNSGIGWMATTRVHAAAAVWGVGRVSINGRLLTDSAIIHAAALSHGAQADDDTHVTLPQARTGDSELQILVWNLPLNVEPRGFLQISFDDVEIDFDGTMLKSVAQVPNVSEQPLSPMSLATPLGGVSLGTALAPPTRPGDGLGGSGFNMDQEAVTGLPGGPITPVSPGTLSGPGSADPSVIPGVSVGTEGVAVGTADSLTTIAPSPAGTVGPGAVTPDTISGTFPTRGAPTPPVNISGVMPGSPAPGSQLALEGAAVGSPPPGGPAEAGVAIGGPRMSTLSQGSFTVVPISPPNFSSFAGTGQVSPGIIATPPPIGTDATIPTPPLLGTPGPLTAGTPPPLLGTPAPLNAAPAPALLGTPSPANAFPLAPGAGAPAPGPVAPAGGTGVPPSI
ncbi:elastin [Stigmatella sp. ncwal1]|uniref:Elastin n=1 Tax=Stigmatella ashevillensis TaxID=2995309 RepID=A0ABT5DMY6_9BACT|nr:elastin [Stigmatella ashevillena]MDC0715020.1 elastin [Stigmatella ashevillena]